MKSKLSFFIVILLLAIPLVYLGTVYQSLPSQVPTHFSLDGKPDSYSTKNVFVFLVTFLTAISLAVYLLLTNLQRIDPKKAVNQSPETMQKIAVAIVLLLTAITVIIIYSAVNNGFSLNKVMLPVLGLFFAYLGNIMYSVKPNYFVGIRTPWALEDQDNWRKTHQLAGKLWFVAGIIIMIVTLAAPLKYSLVIMMIITGIVTIVPAIYSYRQFQLSKKNR